MYRILLALCLVLALCVPAFAALSTDQAAVVTSVETLITDMTGVMWGLVLAVTGAVIGVGLFKKFLFKGAR